MSRIEQLPNFERNQFLSAAEPTLDDVLAHLGASDRLSPIRRRDLRSAIRRYCALTGRDPAMVAASVAELKAGLATINFARAGMSRKTLENLRSNLLAALRETGLRVAPNTAKTTLSPDWKVLFERLPSKRLKNGLSRLLHFCSATNIEPRQVNDRVIKAFADALRNGTFIDNPNGRHRATCRLWNEAAATVPCWPRRRLTMPSFRRPASTLPLDSYPRSFREDAEAHLLWMAGEDPFASHPPPRPAKPGTIELRRKHILGAAAALTRRGHAAEEIRSLADLIAPDAVKEILREHMERNGDTTTQYIRDLCKALILIARHWRQVSADHLEALKAIKRRLGADRVGLTEKNRKVLRQFDDERNKALLICLPQTLAELAGKSGRRDVRPAIRMQVALVIEILLMAPMRMGNMIGLRLDRHVLRPGGSGGPVHLAVPGSETKNGEALEYPLPDETVALLDRYLAEFRPALAGPDSPWLFPSRGGGRKAQETLSQQLVEAVKRHTGIVLTPHQFRHIAAKILLDADLGNFETARSLLGHKTMKTTTGFYTGLQTGRAAGHYDALLLKERERLSGRATGGRR